VALSAHSDIFHQIFSPSDRSSLGGLAGILQVLFLRERRRGLEQGESDPSGNEQESETKRPELATFPT
jgi:hypothetical protein